MDWFPDGPTGYSPGELLKQSVAASVFKARQHSTGRPVIVKLMRRPPVHHRRAMAALPSHPHIASLIDAGQTRRGFAYTIWEFVPGETLGRLLLHRGRLDMVAAATLMAQVLDALAGLHAGGIVHGDLSPQNIVVTNCGARPNVKLIDLDLSAQIAKGTPGYCAPEQLRGHASTPATDLYAWGLIFLECLSGRPAVPGLSPADKMRSHVPPDLRGHALEPPLRDVLNPNLEARAVSAQALHARLQQWLAGDQHCTDPPRAQEEHVVATRGAATVLCIGVDLTPLSDAALDWTLLAALQDEQQQACALAIAHGGGRLLGAVGHRMLFQFAGTDDGLWHAALEAIDLRADLARRSRLLQMRYRARLDLRASLHRDAAADRAAITALHLNRLAGPGAIVLSPDSARPLRDLLYREELAGLTTAGAACQA